MEQPPRMTMAADELRAVRRTREVARKLAVTCRKERNNVRDVRPQYSDREGTAVDVPYDDDARLRVDQSGRQARRMHSDAGRPLAIAEDVMG